MSARIVTGDCLEVMPGIEGGTVQLVFADPPYNIGVQYGDHHDDRMPKGQYLSWSRRWIESAVGLLTPEGSMWVLINHEWSAHIRLMLEEGGLHHRQTITWYETFGVNCTRKFNRCSRPLLWMTRSPDRFVFNTETVRIRSARQSIYGDKRANPAGKILDDVWVIPRLAGTHRERISGFPTQLPLELLRRIIGCATDPAALVFDPFSGSATTGVASLELGRRFLGIKKSERFSEMARTRLRNVTMYLDFSR
jgi:site-specific DNA-methyltransferase (adenine-specific)